MIRLRLGIRWVLVFCLLLVLVGGIAVGGDSVQDSSQLDVVTADGEVVEVQSVVSDPRDDETVTYELTYHLGSAVSSLEVTVTDGAVEPGTGFTATGSNTYEWDEENAEPTLEVELDVDQSADHYDGLDFTGTDEWALVGTASTKTQFSGTGDLSFERTMEHPFEGVAGDEMSYIGPYDSETVSTSTGDIEVVTSAAADSPLSHSEIGDILARTANQLHLTDTTDDLHAYIVTDPLRRGGLASGGNADFWVHEASLEPPQTTLWHEYVHSQQNFNPEADVQWTVEGEADYYAYLLAMKQGEIEYHDFHSFLDGADEAHADAVLADPGTWESQTDYELGALVLAALDREIREESSGTDTYLDVMQTKNEEGGDAVMRGDSVSDEEFESFVSDAARTDMSRFFETHIRSEPGSLSVPAPDSYGVDETGSELAIEVIDAVVGAGQEGAIELAITNTGDGTSIVPFVEIHAPDEVADGQLGINADEGVESTVTAVDDGWAINHLESGDTVVVQYIFDAPDDDELELDDIDALVTDRGGESAATSSAVAVVEAPEVSIDAPDVVHAGESATFNAIEQPQDQDIVSYTWELTGPTDETIETDEPELSYQFTDAGEHTVVLTVENADGATTTVAEEFLVNDQPTVTIDAPEHVSSGESFLAEAEIHNEFGSSDVEWEANGLEATAERVEFEFTSDGERALTVTVTDEYGASTTDTTTVVVGDPDESEGIAEEIEDAVGPGFGPAVALVALVGLLLFGRFRR